MDYRHFYRRWMEKKLMTFSARFWTLGLLALAAPVQLAKADIIYRETFSVDSSSAKLSYAGWKLNFGANGGSGTDYQNSIANSASATTSLAPINSNSAAASNANGYVYNSYTGAWNAQTLYWTDELTISTSAYTLDSISWYQVMEKTEDYTRVALRIGTQWYVSQQTFSGAAWSSTFANAAQQKTLVFKDSLWLPLTFSSGSLSLGSGTISLPTGNITAFGLFADNKTGAQMFDTYEIQATPVPESASVGAGVAGAAILLTRRSK